MALFDAPARCEEVPKKRLAMGLNRTRVVGQKVVARPPEDVVLKPLSDVAIAECGTECGMILDNVFLLSYLWPLQTIPFEFFKHIRFIRQCEI